MTFFDFTLRYSFIVGSIISTIMFVEETIEYQNLYFFSRKKSKKSRLIRTIFVSFYFCSSAHNLNLISAPNTLTLADKITMLSISLSHVVLAKYYAKIVLFICNL